MSLRAPYDLSEEPTITFWAKMTIENCTLFLRSACGACMGEWDLPAMCLQA